MTTALMTARDCEFMIQSTYRHLQLRAQLARTFIIFLLLIQRNNTESVAETRISSSVMVVVVSIARCVWMMLAVADARAE